MALTMKQTSIILTTLGLISFAFGVAAENKKPANGVPIPGKDVVICKYPGDPSVYLGCLSVIFLISSTVAGYLSLFYPYDGKSVPCSALFESNTLFFFFNIAMFTAGLGFALLVQSTVTEHMHKIRNVHLDLNTQCPTAKTGIFGGGAFLSLDSTLFWLLALMLVNNAREDYFHEQANKVGSFDQESLAGL